MIVRLRGVLVEVSGQRVVLDCAGVGYEVSLPATALPRLPMAGEEVMVHTRQIFREDGQSLVGFLDPAERRLFDLLTEVKGCGPKVSLQVIGDLGAETAATAIASEDVRTLAKATGVGPRLAERIVVELREKVRQEAFALRPATTYPNRAIVSSSDHELVDALLALGYRRTEADAAIAQAGELTGSVEERLRVILRLLAR